MQGLERNPGGIFFWVDPGFSGLANLRDLLRAWRWEIEESGDGSVTRIFFQGSKIGEEELLFQAIAPYVASGSYIKMIGEDETVWRWWFTDGKMHQEQVSCREYPRDHFGWGFEE